MDMSFPVGEDCVSNCTLSMMSVLPRIDGHTHTHTHTKADNCEYKSDCKHL